jgi:hypothetical protein
VTTKIQNLILVYLQEKRILKASLAYYSLLLQYGTQLQSPETNHYNKAEEEERPTKEILRVLDKEACPTAYVRPAS